MKTGKRRWWVYLLSCERQRSYAGIALDVQARFAQHASGKGARYTRANPPLAVLGAKSFGNRSAALRAEYALKQLTRPEKLAWARAQRAFKKSPIKGRKRSISTKNES
jgi:putative endonuclease